MISPSAEFVVESDQKSRSEQEHATWLKRDNRLLLFYHRGIISHHEKKKNKFEAIFSCTLTDSIRTILTLLSGRKIREIIFAIVD